jgi:hypothetical protein
MHADRPADRQRDMGWTDPNRIEDDRARLAEGSESRGMAARHARHTRHGERRARSLEHEPPLHGSRARGGLAARLTPRIVAVELQEQPRIARVHADRSR